MSRLKREVDIVEMVRSRRFLHLTLKQILDKPIRKELKELSKFELVSINKADKSSPKMKKVHPNRSVDISAEVQEMSL